MKLLRMRLPGLLLAGLLLLSLTAVACTSASPTETAAEPTSAETAEEADDHADEADDHADEDHADEAEEHADEEHADEEHADEEHDDHDDEDHADEDHDDHADEDHADEHDDHDHEEAAAEMLMLPELTSAELQDAPLAVVATTSIIGDVVAQVGGDAIDLTTLMGPGQDPHSYEPGAQELTSVASADVIFLNGWGLEEGLADDIETIAEGALIVEISAGIEPLEFGADEHDHDEEHADEDHDEEEEHAEDEHDHSGADPHVWLSVTNVNQWTENVEEVLSALDPANADTYHANAEAYLAELAELAAYADEQLALVPDDNRYLVTNHDAFGYFAHDYNFEVIGTVIPGSSTLSEPSASDLAELIEEMEYHEVCTIFTETTVSDSLAQTVSAELDECDEVTVAPLYTGALGPADSGADTYLTMMQTNIDTIVEGLQ